MKILKRLIIFILSLFVLAVVLILIFRTPDIPVEELMPKYANEASRFFAFQGMQIHYREEGPKDDMQPMVLIHGTGSSLHTWDSLVAALPDIRCIRLDIPGFGLTGPHPERNYSSNNTNMMLDELLKYLKVDSCIIAGNSLGGLIAWSYALDHSRAKKIILIDAVGFNSGSKGKNLAFQIARIPVLNQILKLVTPRYVVRKSLEQSYGDPSKVTDFLVDRYLELHCRTGNRQAFLDRFMIPSSGDTSRLHELTIPVLLLWGSKDQLIPVSQADKFAAILPQNQKIVYPLLGHVPMEEAPRELARNIRAWLKK